jgi:transposase-like protein
MPMLTWVRAIFLAMQGKRGISALEIQKQLKIGSYRTAWYMLHRIRKGLHERDEKYQLSGIVEFDGAVWGKKSTKTEVEVLVAVETKDWVDDKGKPKASAGFAKVVVANENGEEAQKFVSKLIKPDSMVNTDGSPALYNVTGVDADYRIMNSTQVELNLWLPWVHKFISNAKAWVVGTHHGVDKKYLQRYLSEFAYRFNRRHDPESLFYRALSSCTQSKPLTLRSLCA